MQQWLLDNFPQDFNGNVFIYGCDDARISFDPSDPSGIFSSITTTPPTYATLSALAVAQQGWQKIFEQWKENGIVA